MSMISTLVNELRHFDEREFYEPNYEKKLLERAANTIEMLSAKARGQEWTPCQGDSVSRRYLLAEIDDLADEFSEVDENGLHSERWCGIMDSKRVIENTPGDIPNAKEGEWVTKAVKKFCAPDCWYPGIFAIEGSWNEKEGSWLEEQNGFCSECEKQDEHYYGHKYCPNCGSKMRGEHDD